MFFRYLEILHHGKHLVGEVMMKNNEVRSFEVLGEGQGCLLRRRNLV